MLFRGVFIVWTICYCYGQDSTPGCQRQSTVQSFENFVQQESACMVTSGASTFSVLMGNAPVLSALYNDEDVFNAAGLSIPAVNDFCQKLMGCTEKLISDCDTEMNELLRNMGTALCMPGGQTKTFEIEEAVNTLKSGGCDLNGDTRAQPSGCHMTSSVTINLPYLGMITRKRKIHAAENRCLFRFLESEGLCSQSAGKAYATVFAASITAELMGMSNDGYTAYNTPKFDGERETLAIFGSSHIQTESGMETCQMPGTSILFWNSYIQIDITARRINPMEDKTVLYDVTIQFNNDDGTILAQYYTVADQDMAMTLLSGETSASTGSAQVVVSQQDNLIVLDHSLSGTTVVVSNSGGLLSVLVRAPKALLAKETVGLLVDGCISVAGHKSVTDITSGVTAECINQCSSVSEYRNYCAYDCSVGALTQTQALVHHNQVMTDHQAAKNSDGRWEVSSAHQLYSAITILLLSLVATII